MALNIPPIQPIQPLNNIGRSAQPISDNLKSIRPADSKSKTAFDSLDINKIGKGRLMTEGSYDKQLGVKQYSGLKGQLMKVKKEGRHTATKNISRHNIEQIHDIIADRLKKKPVGSPNYINRKDKMAIMKESRKLVKTEDSKFTWQDRKDLKKIVNTMQEQNKDKILHKEDSANISPITESQSLNKKGAIDAQPSVLPEYNTFDDVSKLPTKISLDNLPPPAPDDEAKLKNLKNTGEDLAK